MDEREADPISWTLLNIILQWAINSGNIFVCVFSLLQWHCMARSQNIDDLAFHNFKRGPDCLKIKYDKTKMDQTGEKTHPKHCFDNPFKGLVSLYTALGVWCCLERQKLSLTEKLWLRGTEKFGSAAHRYCTQLSQLLQSHISTLSTFVRPSHANPHGFRKGSATYANSGTTMSACLSAIATRGEWSLGKVLDIYWHFAEPGDTYLGRLIAGFNPNKAQFGSAPPHWKVVDPMAHESIHAAMYLCFGPILEAHQGTHCDPNWYAALLFGFHGPPL